MARWWLPLFDIALNARPNHPRAASRSTILYNDGFRPVAVGAVKPTPLVFRIDWLDEGDVHRFAAFGTRIAGGGGLA